jgi:hypothetical protein
MDGWTKAPEDRAMLDILLSCTSRQEFDEVMRLAGGVEELEPIHEEIKEARAAVRKFAPTFREMVNESPRELHNVQAGGKARAEA